MKKQHSAPLFGRVLTALGLCTLMAVSVIYAQLPGQRALSGSIPFEFTLGKKNLPAGTYKFVLSPTPSGFPLLTVSSSGEGKMMVPVLTTLGGGFDFGDARLVFDTVGSSHVLSEVWMSGQDGLLIQSSSKEHTHQTVLISPANLSAKLSGDKIYEQTCQKCHGSKGQGNPAADKFFQAAIPKLASESVQSKSDEELKDIIAHGRRNMPPVRIGQATVQHLLPPEAVDAVIGFLRTLK